MRVGFVVVVVGVGDGDGDCVGVAVVVPPVIACLVFWPTIPYPVVVSLPEQMESLSHW